MQVLGSRDLHHRPRIWAAPDRRWRRQARPPGRAPHQCADESATTVVLVAIQATGRVIGMRLLLLAFGVFSAALVLSCESIFAANPDHVAQVRATKKCDAKRCDLT